MLSLNKVFIIFFFYILILFLLISGEVFNLFYVYTDVIFVSNNICLNYKIQWHFKFMYVNCTCLYRDIETLRD